MPSSEDAASNAAESCTTRSSVTADLQSAPPSPAGDISSAKPGATADTSCPGSGRTSKRFVDEDSKSPEYRSDAWRMANFKVVPCAKRYAHDWTICPFAHPGEKARRRDPRVYKYAGIACPEMKKAGFCSRGEKCPYAHNVFEFWLHPTRYRTQLCNDGPNCTRNVCFFAHTVEEMRPLPSKFGDLKGEGNVKGGAVSPDTPFMQPGASLLTSSSTSSDVWHMLSPEDRARSSSQIPDEYNLQKGHRKAPNNDLIDELANSLANVKIAMAGDKRDEVITMLSKLLQEAAEDKAAELPSRKAQFSQPMATSGLQHNHAAELSLALSALDRSQARSLLADTDRRKLMASQLANSAPDAGQDWQYIVQQLLEAPMDVHLAPSAHRPPSGNTLFTAPASLAQVTRSGDLGGHMASRVLSADLGMGAQHSYWPNSGVHDLHQLPELSRSASHLPQGLGGDIDVGQHQLPPLSMLDDSLFGAANQYQLAAANPNALRRQSVNMDELPHLPKPQAPRREVRRPPISAFQSASTQDWKQPVGRVPNNELRMRANSGGRMSSSDLATINEGLPPLSYNSCDLFQCAQLDNRGKFQYGMDRSKSTSVGVEPVLNLLPSPLSFPATQPGGRDTSALHSAPYNLSLAYNCDQELPSRGRHSFDQQHSLQRQSFELQQGLQGWGGLRAQDFNLNRF